MKENVEYFVLERIRMVLDQCQKMAYQVHSKHFQICEISNGSILLLNRNLFIQYNYTMRGILQKAACRANDLLYAND